MTDQILLRTVADENGAAILDTVSGTITTLNATGAFIWQALQAGETEEHIVVRLSGETGEPVEVVREGVAIFTKELRHHLLLASTSPEAEG